MTVPVGGFDRCWPAVDRPDLIGEPVAAALKAWSAPPPVRSVLAVETDPAKADTAVFCEEYGVPPEQSANCVIVAGKRGQQVTMAACMVLASARADVNGLVRRYLGARKASFASMDEAVSATGMEYGGITPIGLPDGWPILIDTAVAGTPWVVIGSGRRRGKLLVPGELLAALPGSVVVDSLGVR